MNQASKHLIQPPSRSKGLLSDVAKFLLHKPKKATLIKFDSDEERDFL